MTPLAILCEIIALGGKVAATQYRDNPGSQVLLNHEYLIEAGVLASVVCNDCDEAHAAPVVFEDGFYGYHCPELGFVSLDRTDVHAVLPDLHRLIEGLAEALECTRRKQTPVQGQTYRIGAHKADAGEIMLYFHSKLQSEEDARELAHALSREVRAEWRLTVTAVGNLQVAGTHTVQLDEMAALESETGALRILAQPAELIGVPRKNKGGRPSEQGPALAEIILDRKNSGVALSGLNAESRAVLVDFESRYPDKHAPSLATVKRHLTKSRGGS